MKTVDSEFVSLVHHIVYFPLLFATVFAIWSCTDVDVSNDIV